MPRRQAAATYGEPGAVAAAAHPPRDAPALAPAPTVADPRSSASPSPSACASLPPARSRPAPEPTGSALGDVLTIVGLTVAVVAGGVDRQLVGVGPRRRASSPSSSTTTCCSSPAPSSCSSSPPATSRRPSAGSSARSSAPPSCSSPCASRSVAALGASAADRRRRRSRRCSSAVGRSPAAAPAGGCVRIAAVDGRGLAGRRRVCSASPPSPPATTSNGASTGPRPASPPPAGATPRRPPSCWRRPNGRSPRRSRRPARGGRCRRGIVPVVGHQGEALERAVHVGRDGRRRRRRLGRLGRPRGGAPRPVGGSTSTPSAPAPGRCGGSTARCGRRRPSSATSESPWLVAPHRRPPGAAARRDRPRRRRRRARRRRRRGAPGAARRASGRPTTWCCSPRPSESRPIGGFVGAYAEIVFDDGAMTLVQHGNVDDLNEAGARAGAHEPGGVPRPLPARGGPTGTGSRSRRPPTSRPSPRRAASCGRSPAAGRLDGVIYVDSAGVAALLELTGPGRRSASPRRRLTADDRRRLPPARPLRGLPAAAGAGPVRRGRARRGLRRPRRALAPGPDAARRRPRPCGSRGHLAVYSFDETAAASCAASASTARCRPSTAATSCRFGGTTSARTRPTPFLERDDPV